MSELFTIRSLRPEDWPPVRAIYEEGIATGQATFQTGAPEWAEWDRGHLPHSRLVVLAGEAVAGWAALTPVSGRPVYRGVAEVSVYVGEPYRGKGLGLRLLEALVAESERNGIWTLQSSIFPENEASVRIHEKSGFRVLGRREWIGQQNGVWRDTVVLERRSRVIG